MALATMSPSKFGDHFVTDRAMALLSESGCLHGYMVVRSDQEFAIKYMADEVGTRRVPEGGGKRIAECSLVGPGASHRVVERALQWV